MNKATIKTILKIAEVAIPVIISAITNSDTPKVKAKESK